MVQNDLANSIIMKYYSLDSYSEMQFPTNTIRLMESYSSDNTTFFIEFMKEFTDMIVLKINISDDVDHGDYIFAKFVYSYDIPRGKTIHPLTMTGTNIFIVF